MIALFIDVYFAGAAQRGLYFFATLAPREFHRTTEAGCFIGLFFIAMTIIRGEDGVLLLKKLRRRTEPWNVALTKMDDN